MPTIFSKIVLFFSSYVPLMLIFAFRTVPTGTIFWVFIGASALSIALLIWFLRISTSMNPFAVEVAVAHRKDEEVVSYLVTYILPFLGISFSNFRDVVAVCIVFSVVLVIYVRSNLIHVNPLLAVAGYHLFEIVTNKGRPATLITRRSHFRNGESVSVVTIDNYIWLEKPK